jgi:hypothetical protein
METLFGKIFNGNKLRNYRRMHRSFLRMRLNADSTRLSTKYKGRLIYERLKDKLHKIINIYKAKNFQSFNSFNKWKASVKLSKAGEQAKKKNIVAMNAIQKKIKEQTQIVISQEEANSKEESDYDTVNKKVTD